MSFEIEENIPFEEQKTVRNSTHGYINKAVETCLLMKENTSFLVPKDSFTFKKEGESWEKETSRKAVLQSFKHSLKAKLTNISDFKIQTTDGGIRIWYKPIIKAV